MRVIWSIGSLMLALGLLACFMGCGGGGSAPTGTLEGYVYVPDDTQALGRTAFLALDRSTPPEGYRPLVDAVVDVVNDWQTLSTGTDSNGFFHLAGVRAGEAQVTITPPDGSPYLPLTSTVRVAENSTTGVGQGGQVSLLSDSADELSVVINRIDTQDWPQVRVYVSVLDPVADQPLLGDGPENFTVRVNDELVSPAVEQAESAEIPISVALVLDRSGSMAGDAGDDQPLHDLQAGARHFVELLSDGDECAVISLGNDVRVDQPFTDDTQALISAIDGLTSGGGTPLFDAVWQAATDTAARPNPRKAVIAMTDGGENSSDSSHGGGSNPDVGVVTSYAQSHSIPVYTIGLDGFDFWRGRTPRTGSSEDGRWHVDRRSRSPESDLQTMATGSGGEYFYAPTSEQLTGIYQRIRIRTQQQYILTLTAPHWGAETCGVTLEVTHSGRTGQASGSAVIPPRFVLPVGDLPVSMAFKDPRYVEHYGKWHKGADQPAPADTTTVYAAAKGTVLRTLGTGEDTALIVRHRVSQDVSTADGATRDVYVVYGHIYPSVTSGTVESGDPLGTIRPYSGGAHLHLGVRIGQDVIDMWGRGDLVNGAIPAADAFGLTDGWTDPLDFLRTHRPDNTW